MKNNTTKTEIFLQQIGFRFSKEPIKLAGETTPIFRADRQEPYYMPFVVAHSSEAPQEAIGYVVGVNGEMVNIRSIIEEKSKVPVFSTREEATKIMKISMKFLIERDLFKDRQLFFVKDTKNKQVISKATAKNQFDDTLFMSSLKQLNLESVAAYAVDENNQEINTLSKTLESMIDSTLEITVTDSKTKINLKNPTKKDIEVMESALSGKFALAVMRGTMDIMKDNIDNEEFRDHIENNNLQEETEEFITSVGKILEDTANVLKKEAKKGLAYNKVAEKISQELKNKVEKLIEQELKFAVATGKEIEESNSDLDTLYDKKQSTKNKEYAKQLEEILNTKKGEEMIFSAGKQLAAITLFNKDLISREMFEKITQESVHPNTIASVKTINSDDDIMSRLVVAEPTKEEETETEKQIIKLFKRYSKEQMQSLVDSIGMDKLEKRYSKKVIKIIKDNLK